jgi:hypothetical protein
LSWLVFAAFSDSINFASYFAFRSYKVMLSILLTNVLQLFVLLSRAIGLPTRLVYSLQPVSFKPSDLVKTYVSDIVHSRITG